MQTIRRVMAVLALLALTACSQGPSIITDVNQSCKAAGLAAGTPEFEQCVAAKRQAELRQLYDLAIRDPLQT